MTRRALFSLIPAATVAFSQDQPSLAAMWMLDPLRQAFDVFVHGPADHIAVVRVLYSDAGVLLEYTGAVLLSPLRGERYNGLVPVPCTTASIRVLSLDVRVYRDEPVAEFTAQSVMPAQEVA